MSTNRVDIVRRNLELLLRQASEPTRRLGPTESLVPGSTLTAERALALFIDQVRSRELDVAARQLRAEGHGYYTISSAGHEDNAVIGALLRLTDPCFLHYRSGAFMMARARLAHDSDVIRDTLLSFVAAADDPIAQGRHKVWGSRRLWVVPQTSTIASHLPKAVGAAFAHDLGSRLGLDRQLPADAIVCCSFGDASVNHATALSGINAARYAYRRSGSMPVLLLCEDNGIGISVPTPPGWIRNLFADMPHLEYVHLSGEIDELWDRARQAIEHCRESRMPVLLHLQTVRLWGHAGSDVEQTYRSQREIETDEARDPLLRTARRLLERGAATPRQLREIVRAVGDEIQRATKDVIGRPALSSREGVTEPLAPFHQDQVLVSATRTVDGARRAEHFGQLPEDATAPPRRTPAALLNATLHDELLSRPNLIVFGEDVARKGGVYHVTAGLQQAFGPNRVFDTLLDETTILGVAQGAGLLGLLPVAEIQYLAYLHNALDQLRGEACSLAFFSSGQFRNPMVVRVASFAYQRGIGGHFHNDNAIGALRDIPGLIIAAPSRGRDAARMLRAAIAMAEVDGRVVCFLEPIALYHEKDLYEAGDGRWLSDYPAPGAALLPGEVGVYGAEHTDLLIVSYANGLRLALRAARRLVEEQGIVARVLDLRWLAPLPHAAIRAHAERCGRVLVADECRATGGGVADAIIAGLAERGLGGAVASVRSADTYVPLGPAADSVLLGEDDIVGAALELSGR